MAEEPRTNSMGGCLLQLFWTLVGPGLLFAMGVLLIVNHPPLGSWPDFAFLGLALAIALARLLDGRKPESASPAATNPVGSGPLQYVAILAGVPLLILVVAHLVAPRLA
jgi:hypothetical protein